MQSDIKPKVHFKPVRSAGQFLLQLATFTVRETLPMTPHKAEKKSHVWQIGCSLNNWLGNLVSCALEISLSNKVNSLLEKFCCTISLIHAYNVCSFIYRILEYFFFCSEWTENLSLIFLLQPLLYDSAMAFSRTWIYWSIFEGVQHFILPDKNTEQQSLSKWPYEEQWNCNKTTFWH